MTSLPAPGRLNCSRCFPSGATWGHSTIEQDGWILENNPMSWGAKTPRYLVLGFSKGTRQCEDLLTTPHDQVPFAGFRHNVTAILQTLGLLAQGESVESHLGAAETDFAFGSLIRCSVAHLDPATGKASKSGSIINRLSQRSGGEDWALNCTTQFLADLPPTLRVVVLLSNDDDYVDACFERLRTLRPGMKRINPVAYSDDQITWIHTVHGSPLAQSHINKWLDGSDGVQGQKQRDAVAVISAALGIPSRASSQRRTAALHKEQSSRANAPRPRTTGTGEGRPLPVNPMRDAINSALKAHPSLRPHPNQKEETKYISAFVTGNGRALALDKMAAGRQPIWVEARLIPEGALPDIERDFYPAERGRNSNLHKLPGFKEGALVRLYPKTVAQATVVVDLLMEA